MPPASDAQLHQAIALHQQGRFSDAEALYRRVLAADPNNANALHLLGLIAFQFGHLQAAAELARRATTIAPNAAAFHAALGNVLYKLGRAAEAADAYRQTLALSPPSAPAPAEVWNNLANALSALGRHQEAADALTRAIELNPNSVAALCNLAHANFELGKLDQAVAACDAALAIDPNDYGAHLHRANLLKEQARHDEAIAAYRKAVSLESTLSQLHAGLLFAMHFDPATGAATLLQEHRAWAERFADPLTRQAAPHATNRDPNRHLKVGLVSPDLRNHGVGRFMLPLLEHHDRKKIELVCYSTAIMSDTLMAQLRGHADGWHDVAPLNDAALAAKIREDNVDILIDLSLHMAGSRLLVFARKPAPIQATYLGYAGTSGMAAMDFRITDPSLDPPGARESLYTERPAYIDTYWCYSPPEESTEIVSPPMTTRGHVTFGCLNTFAKVNAGVLQTWRDLLARIPDARLILHALEGSHRDDARALLNAGDRVFFVGYQSMHDYFAAYNQIDIALDPFPYAGGTTTCDALWMGVPVVTLAGHRAVARGGVSILSAVDLPELIAQDQNQYIQIATELANDLPRLTSLRATMRDRMLRSRLMDGPAFARSFESALRNMWAQFV